MAEDLFKPEDLVRKWAGYDRFKGDLDDASAAIHRIVTVNARAAGDDEYGNSYIENSKDENEYVLSLTEGVKNRVGLTGEAGSHAVTLLDRAEGENLHHASFGSHEE